MIKEIHCLPSIEIQYGNTPFKKEYCQIAYNAINGIYKMLVNHPLFVSQMDCPYNSREDVKREFDEHVSNYLIMTYADFENESHMLAYNLMISNERGNGFYNKWKNELFEFLLANH